MRLHVSFVLGLVCVGSWGRSCMCVGKIALWVIIRSVGAAFSTNCPPRLSTIKRSDIPLIKRFKRVFKIRWGGVDISLGDTNGGVAHDAPDSL